MNEDQPRVFQPQRTFPFRVCELELPNCQSGFVYFLISRDHPGETYIGECQDLNVPLWKHNSGNGSEFTSYYPPYGVYAYVCGFDGNLMLCQHFEGQWKSEVTAMICQGVNCVIQWALVAEKIITRIRESHNFPDQHDLRFVTLFDPF